MYKLPLGLLLAAALLTTVLPTAEAQTSSSPAVKFGMDAAGVAAQKAAGVAPDYGTMWIGPWTLKSGWGGPDAELAALKSAGVTPAVHFYYWGDDISPSCVENGCWSSLHQAQKTRAGWDQLGTQLTSHLNTKMGGAPVVVFLESEFNKGGIATYEPFDGYMAAMAKKINAAYPAAIVVLGFGAWDSGNWYRFDQAAAASEMVGIQAMRGSTKDSAAHYNSVYEGTLDSVKKLKTLFGKPVMLTDLALSSYPDSTYASVQAANLREIFANLNTLQAAGMTSMIYRSWKDTQMDPANYYGYAEQHWGLAWSNGVQKEAGKVWVAGVKAERSGATATTTTSATSTSTAAGTSTTSFKVTPASSSSEWWVQVGVAPAPAKVEIKVGSGAYVTLDKQSYGFTKSLHIAKGTSVSFRVTGTDGKVGTTPAQAWLVDMSAKSTSGTTAGTTTTAAPTTSAPATSGFTASFTPKSKTNNWWIETAVSGNQAVVKVEAKVSSGSYVTLDKTSYGTFAKSINAPDGAQVTFRATSSTGATATSSPIVWGY